jgi:NitT/TauT family transport system permease protein
MAQTYLPPVPPPPRPPTAARAWWLDLLLILTVAAVLYATVLLATRWVRPASSTAIDLSPAALPLYALFSTLRMAVAYGIALAFSLLYARLAIASRSAERILIPLLDILQSIPILSFMPGVVLGLTGLFPGRGLGLEMAAIVLIFTSQAWNIAFGFHQSLLTIPREFHEVAAMHRLTLWDRFTRLELPAGVVSLVWNSMMSWAGGWFFLMASEQFTLGEKDFRLPGLGSYLQQAAARGDYRALSLGLLTLIVIIVGLDTLLWRPLVAWSERFKVEQVPSAEGVTSSILVTWRRSILLAWLSRRLGRALSTLDEGMRRLSPTRLPGPSIPDSHKGSRRDRLGPILLGLIIGLAIAGVAGAGRELGRVSPHVWLMIGIGAGITLGRVAAAIAIGAAWTIPAGVAIGLSPHWSRRLQPIAQIAAAIPATALFPVLLVAMLGLPGGLGLAAILLMLLGTQWYLLFNVIAGAMAIPADLREAAAVYRLHGWNRWRTLILPAIFPYLITGMITATGGAWNTSIVAEYVTFGGTTYQTAGLGALIAAAAATADFPTLFAATLTMITVVVAINRFAWRRLYNLAERRYRLD